VLALPEGPIEESPPKNWLDELSVEELVVVAAAA
jgi:hypothetical protein